MTITDRIQSELRTAMKAGDRPRVDAIRLLMSSLQKAEKDKPAGEFGDRDAEAVLRRERKQRVEAAKAYRDAGHEERAAAEEADLPVIDEFLPQAMDEDELAALVDAAIAETGATSMRDMGKVMGLVTHRADGRADGKTASGPRSQPAFGVELEKWRDSSCRSGATSQLSWGEIATPCWTRSPNGRACRSSCAATS